MYLNCGFYLRFISGVYKFCKLLRNDYQSSAYSLYELSALLNIKHYVKKGLCTLNRGLSLKRHLLKFAVW